MKTFTSHLTLCLWALFSFSSSMAQSFDYEWREVTNKSMRLCSSIRTTTFLTAHTKNGHIVIATEEGMLAETIDTGKTWIPVYDAFDINEDVFTKKAMCNVQTSKFSFSSDSLHGVFYSSYIEDDKEKNILLFTSDGGHTWNESDISIGDNYKMLDMTWRDEMSVFAVFFNNSAKELYIYSSFNFGGTWQKVTENVLTKTVTSLYDSFIAFVNENLGYMFTRYGYCVTKDGGVTWEKNSLDIAPKFLFQFNNGQLLLTVRSNCNVTLEGCRIINMFYQKVGGFEYYNEPFAMYDLGEGKVFAKVNNEYTSENKNIISTDSMRTWQSAQEYYTPPIDAVIETMNENVSKYVYNGTMDGKALYVKSSQEVFVIGAKNGRLFHTTDGGNTWTYKDFNTTLYKMQFLSNEIIYMSSKDSLFISHDGGENWEGKKMRYGQNIHFFSESFGYAHDDIFLYQTQDGGNTWKWIQDMSTEFIDYGGSLNGCFANEHLGLFRSDNSKVILVANIDPEKCTMTFSVVTDSDIKGNMPRINIEFYNDRWILTDWWYGYIYTCEKDLTFKKVADPMVDNPNNTHSANNYQKIIDYGNGVLLLPNLTENNLYLNDTARISYDGGVTWEGIPFLSPNALLLAKSDNPNVIYACEKGRYLHVYKGVHKVKNADFSFEKQENGTIQCSISNADNQNYIAKVVIEQVNGTSIVINEKLEIKSGESFVVTLPQNITANYVLKVIPEDEEVYETVQSQEFIVNNGGSAIDAVSSDDIQIRVVNGKIECSCEEYTIYNVAGQKVQNNASLPSGTYFVHYGTQVKKVVVQ